MDDISIFQEKDAAPSETDLKAALKDTFSLWKTLHEFVLAEYPAGKPEWNYPGKKYGWNYRIKDKKRAIIYLLPRREYFKVAFVFGQKAVDEVINNKTISKSIKETLRTTIKIAEERGIRIDIRNSNILPEIEELIKIKLAN